MLKVVQENSGFGDEAAAAAGGSLLDGLVRDGARQMLAAALYAEVAAYVESCADEVDEQGRRLVVRNGHHQPREVSTVAGAVPVRAPRVNDRHTDETGERRRFTSAILPAWARKSPHVAEVLPLLYLHGLSSHDFGPALEGVPRFGGRVVAGHDHPPDHRLAAGGGRVPHPLTARHRLRLPVGRRHPPQGPPRTGQGVPAGDDRGLR